MRLNRKVNATVTHDPTESANKETEAASTAFVNINEKTNISLPALPVKDVLITTPTEFHNQNDAIPSSSNAQKINTDLNDKERNSALTQNDDDKNNALIVTSSENFKCDEASSASIKYDSVSSSSNSKYIMGSILPRPYGSTPGTSGLFSRPKGLQTNPTWSVLGPTMAQQSINVNHEDDGIISTGKAPQPNIIKADVELNEACVDGAPNTNSKNIKQIESDYSMSKQELAQENLPTENEFIAKKTDPSIARDPSNHTSTISEKQVAGSLPVLDADETQTYETSQQQSLPALHPVQYNSSPINSENLRVMGHHRTASLPVTYPSNEIIASENSPKPLALKDATSQSKSLLAVIRSSPSQTVSSQGPTSSHNSYQLYSKSDVTAQKPDNNLFKTATNSTNSIPNLSGTNVSVNEYNNPVKEHNNPVTLAHLKPDVSINTSLNANLSVNKRLSPVRQNPSSSIMDGDMKKLPAAPGLYPDQSNNSNISLTHQQRFGLQQIPDSPNSLKTSNLSGSNSNIARPPFRYASKSVIANTYMKKLTRPGLSQYATVTNALYPTATTSNAAVPSNNIGNTGFWPAQNQPPAVTRQQNFDASIKASADVAAEDSYPIISPALAAAVDGAMKRRHSHSDFTYPNSAFVPPGFEGEKFSFRPYAPRSLRRRSFSSEDEFHEHLPQNVSKPQNLEITNSEEAIRSVESISDLKTETTQPEPREGEPDRSTQQNAFAGKLDSDSNQNFNTTGKAGVLKRKESTGRKISRRVSFDPLALLLDSALEGEMDLLKKAISQVLGLIFF